jgi:hypothetical protein
MARDLFVSYSQPDREAAFALVQRLEAHGISVWIAPRDVSPAADWAAEIIDAISNARLMVLVFSASSNDSGQVRREVERAVNKQLPILPFRIENVLPSKSLEYFLSTQHWMDAFSPPLESHIDRLCDYVDTMLGRHAAPDAPEELRPGSVDAAHLRLLEAELAKRVGPVAGHLVRRAIRDGGTLDTLAQRLAPEIDGELDRRVFLETCWRIGKGK